MGCVASGAGEKLNFLRGIQQLYELGVETEVKISLALNEALSTALKHM